MGLDNADLVLEWDMLFCPLHGEPYRHQWPTGCGIAIACFCGQYVHNKEVQSAVGDVEFLIKNLKHKPACCRLPIPALEQIYMESLYPINGDVLCSVCKCKQPGAPCTFRNPRGIIEERNICFHCIMTNLQMGLLN